MSNTSPTATPTSSSVRTRRSKFTQLARTPWVPERLLQEYGGNCSIDSRFRRAARMLQIFWMRDNGIPNAVADSERDTHLGSYLSADAAEAGLNFLSQEIHLLALKEFLLLREEDAAVDEDRLLANSLSSMPLVANCFGPLALDLKLATKVFRQLLPDFVHSVEKVVFEHSPGRRDNRFLADRSAFDVAVHVKTPDGPGIVYTECKYSEDLTGPVARWRERYDQALTEVRLYKDPASLILRSAPIEQLMREHCVAQLSVDNGITPRAMFIAVGPRLNRRVAAAFTVYANELLPIDGTDRTRVPFRHFTLESFIDAIDVAGDQTTADRLWQRYCNFQRIYDAALSVLAPRLSSEVAGSGSGIGASAYARVRGTRGGRRQTSVADADSTNAAEATTHA